MTALLLQDGRGRWTVRYQQGAYVGTYTAESREDAEAFLASPDRQAEDRLFAVQKMMARLA